MKITVTLAALTALVMPAGAGILNCPVFPSQIEDRDPMSGRLHKLRYL
jgi:hypothetical protein